MAKKSLKQTKDALTSDQPTFEIYPVSEENRFELVPLSELVALDSTPIPDATHAGREINAQHVSHLLVAIENGEELPPLKVLHTNMGRVVLGGYHRWKAYATNLANVIEDSFTDEDGEVTEQKIDERYASSLSQYRIPVENMNVTSASDAIKIAFQDNLRHGMPASDASRVRFGMWLYANAKRNGEKMSLHQAAAQAGCTHQAMLKAAQRIHEKKMKDVNFDDEELEEIATLVSPPKEEKVVNPLEAANKHMAALIQAAHYFSEIDWTNDELSMFVSGYGKQTTKEALTALNRVQAILYTYAPSEPEPEQQSFTPTATV